MFLQTTNLSCIIYRRQPIPFTVGHKLCSEIQIYHNRPNQYNETRTKLQLHPENLTKYSRIQTYHEIKLTTHKNNTNAHQACGRQQYVK